MSDKTSAQDPFVAMVTAKARVDLRLSDFQPRSMLVTPVHEVQRPRFPVIDYHNHLDALEPADVLRVMDKCGIERVVNITMRTGEAALDTIDKLHKAAADRFATYGWMDWSDLHAPGFFQRTVDRLEKLVERGACGLKRGKTSAPAFATRTETCCASTMSAWLRCLRRRRNCACPSCFTLPTPTLFSSPLIITTNAMRSWLRIRSGAFAVRISAKRNSLRNAIACLRAIRKLHSSARIVAERPEDLAYVSRLLDANPNLYVDIGARCAELGRQPYTAREFFLKYVDRILFGTDLIPEVKMYRLHFRFLETRDEYFEYPSHASRQGRWNIYGLFLPDEVLRRVYRENALALLRR